MIARDVVAEVRQFRADVAARHGRQVTEAVADLIAHYRIDPNGEMARVVVRDVAEHVAALQEMAAQSL